MAQAAVEQRWNDTTAVAPHVFAAAQKDASLVSQFVRRLSDKLALLVSEDPDALDAIEWRDLERMLESVFFNGHGDLELADMTIGLDETEGPADGGFTDARSTAFQSWGDRSWGPDATPSGSAHVPEQEGSSWFSDDVDAGGSSPGVNTDDADSSDGGTEACIDLD